MEEEFVNYEQALALKELGFDEATICYYDVEDLYKIKPTPMKEEINSFHFNSISTMVSAPLKQQAFRWFREKYEFCYHIFSLQITASDKTGYRYSWEIYNHTPEWIAEDSSLLGSLTYEEAENACIDKLIELVKNK
jgi:hypothetical protein